MFSLHRCEDIRNYSKDHPIFEQDQQCAEYLAKHYNVRYVISHGAMGVVLLLESLLPQEKLVALKITQDYKRTRGEVVTTCFVDQLLASQNGTFSRTYGWLSCSLPPQWRPVVEEYAKHYQDMHQVLDESLFLFSEHYGGPVLKHYAFSSLYECKCIVFEVLYAIHWAHQKYGFTHGDLHLGNVVMAPDRNPRVYKLQNKDTERDVYFRIGIHSQPKIIDYDFSSFHNKRTLLEPDYDDVNYFLQFLGRNKIYQGEVAAFIHEKLQQTMSTERMLLELFEELKTPNDKGDSKVECHVCSQPRAFCYRKSPTYTFCSKECADAFPIGQLINE